MRNMSHKRLYLVHHGALGDFLLAWPAMLGLRRAFPQARVALHGPSDRRPLLDPLGVEPVSPAEARDLDSLFSRSELPASLEEAAIAWFCLHDRPPVPVEAPNLWPLPALPKGPSRHVLDAHRGHMEALGLPWPADWRDVFLQTAALAAPALRRGRALLFPGAGHRAKQWPLVQFFELARRLKKHLPVAFVLGPAEQERGPRPEGAEGFGGFEVETPNSLADLLALLQGSALAIGNDSGPLHLAGMLGLRGLALFGPTDPTQWGPPGLEVLARPLPCRPCTRTTANIVCQRPVCLEELGIDLVWEAVEGLLADPKKETGFLEPLQKAGFCKSRKVT